jgi:cellulose biosynthesis protein BcsQ
MICIAVYNEKGGVGKTTSTIGLAGAAAAAGVRVGVVDLDPQFTATTWLGAVPEDSERHVGAILADEDPAGWAQELALPVQWPGGLDITVVPGSRKVALRERNPDEFAETRLFSSFEGWDRDLVLIDVPNRQGGVLVTSALRAASSVVIPLSLDQDGLDALDRSVENVNRFQRHLVKNGVNHAVSIAGVVGIGMRPIPSKENRRVELEIADDPQINVLGSTPDRVIVGECRAVGDWWGNYPAKGAKEVTRAYSYIYSQLDVAATLGSGS